MSTNEKIYVGSGKAVETQYGTLIKLSFSMQDLATMHSSMNEKGYVNLNLNERRTPSDYGQTHSMTIDTWKPDASKAKEQQNYKRVPKQEDINLDDVPF